ncbi:processed acidic surface protein [Aquibacillus kalidii]|uniref:processed acidic surface protein n=1 Tax=Aquibacillus kalidii TaxID=2762597 RepID=UPI0016473329|nr:processed acidic surface protein [Aquibacillus kalidii]
MKKYWLASFLSVLIFIGINPFSTSAAVQQSELDDYLTSIGMSQEQLENYLNENYDDSIANYESLIDLKDFLGETVTEATLQELVVSYDITLEELEGILAESGYTIDEFTFIDDIDFIVSEYYLGDGAFDLIGEMMESFGLTEAEMDKLTSHFETVLNGSQLLEELEAISADFDALGEFDSASDLTAEQLEQFKTVWNRILQGFELQAKYYIVENGVESEVTLDYLLQIPDADISALTIELYNLNGDLLADMVITGEMFGSDLVEDVTIEQPPVQATPEKTTKVESVAKQTEEQNELPNTASPFGNLMLIGTLLLVVGAGIVKFRRTI